MNTLNWRIRQFPDSYNNYFFIEADLPPIENVRHFPKVELIQEDFGDHNGYTHDLRMADALLIVKAPAMYKAILNAISMLNSTNDIDRNKIIDMLSESTEDKEIYHEISYENNDVDHILFNLDNQDNLNINFERK